MFFFMNNRIQTDLPLKIMHNLLINWNTLKNCYSVFRIDLFEKLKACDFRIFEVFNSNVNVLNVLSQFSMKISMRYRKTLF